MLHDFSRQLIQAAHAPGRAAQRRNHLLRLKHQAADGTMRAIGAAIFGGRRGLAQILYGFMALGCNFHPARGHHAADLAALAFRQAAFGAGGGFGVALPDFPVAGRRDFLPAG